MALLIIDNLERDVLLWSVVDYGGHYLYFLLVGTHWVYKVLIIIMERKFELKEILVGGMKFDRILL